MIRAVCATCVALLLAGCERPPETGFVEVKRFASLSGRLVSLNGSDLPDLDKKDAMVVSAPVGSVALDVKTGDRRERLCLVTVRPNRIVTVSLGTVNGRLRCGKD